MERGMFTRIKMYVKIENKTQILKGAYFLSVFCNIILVDKVEKKESTLAFSISKGKISTSCTEGGSIGLFIDYQTIIHSIYKFKFCSIQWGKYTTFLRI